MEKRVCAYARMRVCEKRNAIIFLLGLWVVACDSPTVPERFLRDVYDFRALTPAPAVLRWPVGTTIRVFVVADADATRTQWLHAAVTHGATVWNDAAIYGEVKLEAVTSVQEADAVVAYNFSTSPVDASGCVPSGGLAFTTFCLAPGGERLAVFPLRDGSASNVKFLVTVRSTAVIDEFSARRLVAHELGHVLGIAQHSPKPTDLMYAGTLNREDPSPADRATLQVLYHTRADITP